VLRRTLVLCAIFVFVALAQNPKTDLDYSRDAQQSAIRIDVFESSELRMNHYKKKRPYSLPRNARLRWTITVDDSVKYQEIDGFGASVSESSAWLLKRKLSDSQRKGRIANAL